MSTDAAISAQGAADNAIRRASTRFASYDPRTGLNAKGRKAPADCKSVWHKFDDLEKYSQMAVDREAKKREARNGHCINGHAMTPDNTSPVGNGIFNCIACRRARQPRKNERRRLRRIELKEKAA